MLARRVSDNSYAHLQEHYTVEYSLWYEVGILIKCIFLHLVDYFSLLYTKNICFSQVNVPINILVFSKFLICRL